MRGSTPQEKDLCNDRKVCYHCNYILPSQVHIRGAFSEVPYHCPATPDPSSVE